LSREKCVEAPGVLKTRGRCGTTRKNHDAQKMGKEFAPKERAPRPRRKKKVPPGKNKGLGAQELEKGPGRRNTNPKRS